MRAQLVQPVQAQVVRAALHVGRGEGHAQRAPQRWDVLEVDLLLQVLGAGGDQNPLAIQDRRHEVGQCLAGAGARFREQHPAIVQRVGDGRSHNALALSRLEVIDRADQRTVVGERGVDRGL